jgi:hypothetical protein
MHQYINKTCLITTSGWFYAPDGRQYKAVWGTLKAIHEVSKAFGFIPSRAFANWFIEIGDMTIMGCQVLYVIACDKPNTDKILDWHSESKNEPIVEFERPTAIYITV